MHASGVGPIASEIIRRVSIKRLTNEYREISKPGILNIDRSGGNNRGELIPANSDAEEASDRKNLILKRQKMNNNIATSELTPLVETAAMLIVTSVYVDEPVHPIDNN